MVLVVMDVRRSAGARRGGILKNVEARPEFSVGRMALQHEEYII